MLRGIFALFFRSLRGDSRSIWVHASWLLFLLVIYVAMSFAQSSNVGAPGLLFFQYVIEIDAAFVTLLGIGYFSTAISEEKEEDTLGLMMMAGISPLGILLGKSTTRLFQVLVLLMVQYPFTLLAITLGGLIPEQIYAAYAALFAYTLLLANVGLFCSVVCRRSRDASALTILWIFGYLVTTIFAYAGYMFLTSGQVVHYPHWLPWKPILEPLAWWISQTSVFTQLYAATETGNQFKITPQLFSNSIGGVSLFLLSWWLFEIIPHDLTVEGTPRALGSQKTGKQRWLTTGRVWNRALIWKDFHFVSGGWFGVLMRCGLYVGTYWLAYWTMFPWNAPASLRTINWRDVTEGYQFFVVPLFVVDCALCMSRLFHEEIRQNTLASLLMLPRSIAYVAYSKIGGCLLGLVPGMIAVITAYTLLSESTRPWNEIASAPSTWWMVANLCLIVHLSALFSTYLRWGAFALSLIVTGGFVLLTDIFAAHLARAIAMTQPQLNSLMIIMIIPVALACAGCHLIVLLRLPALGEK